MSALLAGMPVSCPGTTVNRLCASGLEAVAQAARAVCSSEANLVLAGGVESMTRAPFVMGKSSARSEEHTSELQSIMRISYAVFCLNKQIKHQKKKIKVCCANTHTSTEHLHLYILHVIIIHK